MGLHDFKCDNEDCGFTDEYFTSMSLPQDMKCPEVCPKCNKGKMCQQFSSVGGNRLKVHVVGGYDDTYGKRNWKAGKTDNQIAEYLTPGPDGKYKNPY